MLSGNRHEIARAEPASVETRVLELVAETSGLECGELSPATPLAGALDSLTLVAVVTRIEVIFDVVLTAEETIELFAAREVGELGRLIARKVQQSRANLPKDTRKESC